MPLELKTHKESSDGDIDILYCEMFSWCVSADAETRIMDIPEFFFVKHILTPRTRQEQNEVYLNWCRTFLYSTMFISPLEI